MNKQKGFIEVLLAILISAFTLVVLIGGTYWAGSVACEAKTVSFENHEYGFFSGCMVIHHGRWIPLDNIRGFD